MTAPPTPADRLIDLRVALNAELVGREDEVDALIRALASGTHLFLLSAPGMAKTTMVDRALVRIDGVRYGKVVFNRTMPPEALIGPLSLSAFKDDRYHHLTDGYLPTADVFFADELWKGSSAAANLMLPVLQEREFKNGNVLEKVPLHTCIAASNELPTEADELAAAWDRLLQRLVIPEPDDVQMREILEVRFDDDPKPVLSWDEVLAAKAEVRALFDKPTDEAFDAGIEIRRRLRAHGISPSPRRLRESFWVAAAEAYLAGDDRIEVAHLEPLVHCLWDDPSQARDVERVVLEVCSPDQRDAVELADTVGELSEAVNELCDASTDQRGEDWHRQCSETKAKLNRAHDAAARLAKTARGRAGRIVAKTDNEIAAQTRRLLIEAFGVAPEDLR